MEVEVEVAEGVAGVEVFEEAVVVLVVAAAFELEEYVELDEVEAVVEVIGVGKVEGTEVVAVVDAAVLAVTELMTTVGEGWTLGPQGVASARSAAMYRLR